MREGEPENEPFMLKKRKRLTPSRKLCLAANQDWKCKMCNKTLPPTFEVDHIVPLHLNGADCPSNMQALCPNCHRSKSLYEMQTFNDDKREATADNTKGEPTTSSHNNISKYFNPLSPFFLKPL